MDKADYIQYANIGLLESIDNFRPEKGVPFRHYAFKRIKGAILNNIVKFSERAQSKDWLRKNLKTRIDSFQFNEDQDEGYQLVETIIYLTIGFIIEEEFDVDDSLTLKGTSLDSNELKILQTNILKIVSMLPANCQYVMKKHYFENMTFTEIAKMRKLSLGRVSQIHSQALEFIRKKLHW